MPDDKTNLTHHLDLDVFHNYTVLVTCRRCPAGQKIHITAAIGADEAVIREEAERVFLTVHGSECQRRR
jgi:hypothetical protein